MNVAFPFRIDHRGRTAAAGEDEHLRGLLEQVLFTAPGERVRRPELGTGVRELVFAPASAELESSTQLLVQGALQQLLGELVQIDAVEVESEDTTLRITVRFLVRRTLERREARFEGRIAS